MNYNKLRGKIIEKGYTIKSFSQELEIPLSTMSDKLNGKTEFKASEMFKIAKALEIDDIKEYFFNQEVQYIEQK